MREKNQVVLPLDLGICIPEGDFVFKVYYMDKVVSYLGSIFKEECKKLRQILLK